MVGPPGGSSAAGIVGYVKAGLGLAEEVANGDMPDPDWIFVPLGSGGTVAGLTAGLKLAGLGSLVAAVLVTDIFPPSARRLARQAHAALRYLRRAQPSLPQVPVSAADFNIVRGYVGGGDGDPTAEAREARGLVRAAEGVYL